MQNQIQEIHFHWLKASVWVAGIIKSRINTSGAKGFCVGAGRAPPGYYYTRLLARTHEAFLRILTCFLV
jgi:hypothetical protein